MRLWTYAAREVLRRPGRTLLTLLGIAIGVAAAVATSATVRRARLAYQELFEGVTGRASLEVVAGGTGGFDPGAAAGLESLPGVKAAVPRVQSAAALAGPSGTVPVLVLGLDPARAASAAEGLVGPGGLPGDDDAILLPAELARSQGLEVGRPVRLWTPGGPARLVLRGHLRPGAADLGGAVAVVPLATAQRLFSLRGHVNSVQIILADGARREPVRSAVLGRLPPGLTVQSPGARGELGRATMRSAEHGLSFLSLMACVLAAFVVLNTFLLNLGERGRQLATLRALGATRSQVAGLLLREAALLGLAGSALGLGAGLLLASLLTSAVGQFLGVALPLRTPGVEVYLLALALGPGTALAATFFPARRAGRRDPLPELTGRRAGRKAALPRWVPHLGLVLLAAGALLEVGPGCGGPGESVARLLPAPGVAMILVGSVLALPLVLAPLLGLCGRLPDRVLGVAGRLALCQLQRHRPRTALTAGILFLAVVVGLGFGHTLLAVLDDLRDWYRQAVVADFLVRAAMPDSAFLLAASVPEALEDDLRQIEGVAEVDKVAFVPARAGGRAVLVVARTFPAAGPLPIDLTEGEAEAARRGLLEGEAVLGLAVARTLGLHAGESIELETNQGPKRLGVAGTATEYAAGGQALYLEWRAAGRLLGVKEVHAFLIKARPGGAAALAPALRRFCERRHLLLQSNDDLRRLMDRSLAGVTGVLWALMAVAFVVAALGIGNTLTMNVLEQAREFAVLRALGMCRGQVRRLVLAQAALTALASVVPGTAAGLGVAYLVARSAEPLLGKAVRFHIEPVLVAGCAGMALAVSLLAALLPAGRAARPLAAGACPA